MGVSVWKLPKLWISLFVISTITLAIILTSYFISVKTEQAKINDIFRSNSQLITSNMIKDIHSFTDKLEELAIAFGSHGTFGNITKSLFDYLTQPTVSLLELFTVAYDPVVPNESRTFSKAFSHLKIIKQS